MEGGEILPWPAGAWQRLFAEAIARADELIEVVGGSPAAGGGPSAAAAERQFAVRVPRGLAKRIRPCDPGDPILRQVLPVAAESTTADGFTDDPVGELGAARSGGVLQKYHGRALLVVTPVCAVHCRYCFRRHFPYGDHALTGRRWADALKRIAADPTLSEVILSGGDPLTVPDDRLARLVNEIEAIPHVRRLRIHTRLPIVIPERVDEALVAWFARVSVPVVVVVHANHANEIDGDVRRALAVLRRCRATLLNQSVLLAGVNDSVDALCELSERLFEAGALPYYLHLLDRVRGAAQFEVPEAEALRLIAGVRDRMPGYLVPRLVREVAGAPSKVAVELRDEG
ncbi:MAG: EF-P beta-lysylation protein EpmB [Holophagae bacterium]|nr:MAG: EF-P beta-lysylation protein EpmB [Holophagae bacterium]